MTPHPSAALIDSRIAWTRLMVALLAGCVGGVAMWSVAVSLPALQAEFGTDRGTASMPYTATMIGFAISTVLMGRLVDRVGIARPLAAGGVMMGAGYVLAGLAPNLWVFALASLALVAPGCSVTFGPMIADMSHWFVRRRGLAVSVVACGGYLAGVVWPPILERMIGALGWRETHMIVGAVCVAVLVPVAALLRRPSPRDHNAAAAAREARAAAANIGLSPGALQALLCVAGVACCVAMSMPQVHLLAYCTDLGYGPARGAQMLSVMLACGVVSRLVFGWVSDRIGGLRTLMIGSLMQGTALVLYLGFDGLASLYVISALFGLFQGGIVPSYALVVRAFFPPQEAGARVGLVLTATMGGMALGGWISGEIFDLTGSYAAAFANGVGWNAVNAAIALTLLVRSQGGRRMAVA